MSVEDKKRKKNVNFSMKEEELLVELVMKHKHVLENKKTDAIMWREKEQCWGRLVDEFNSQQLLVPRTVGQLQLKYKNMKKVVKKKSALIRLERQKTGGGIDKSILLNDIEQKVKDMIQLSVDGMPSHFDCDTENALESSVFVCDLELDDNADAEFDDDNSNYVTVMPDGWQAGHFNSSTFTPINITEQGTAKKENSDVDVPNICKTTAAGSNSTQFGTKISTPLRTSLRKKKSRTAEATNLLQHKDQFVALQIKCLEQEVEINEVRKKNIILEGEKLKLEIELLKKKLQM